MAFEGQAASLRDRTEQRETPSDTSRISPRQGVLCQVMHVMRGGERLTMKERAKKARREAYLRAKERMKKDPRTIEFKAKIKEARRAASKAAKERRKAQAEATKKAERTGKDARLTANVASATTLASPTVETSTEVADPSPGAPLPMTVGDSVHE
jgi:hypothetical protein